MNEKVTKTCPYLGLLIDPDTISAEADPVNHCHVDKTPQPVEIDYQKEFCLSGHFPSCGIYQQFISQGITEENIEVAIETGLIGQEVIEENFDGEDIGTEENASLIQEEEDLSDQHEDWRKRLHQDAQSNFENVSNTRSRTGLWVFLFVVAIAILALSVWGIINRFSADTASAQQGNGGEQPGNSLATVVSEMGIAAKTWETAAIAMEIGSDAQATNIAATSTEISIKAQQDLEATMQAQQSAIVACNDLEEAEFVIVNGPTLEPGLGYQHVEESEIVDVEAAWLIENTGSCIWENIFLLYVDEADVITPTLRIDGEDVSLANPDGRVFVQPNERIEIVLQIPVEEAVDDIDEEYIVLINGLTLVNQPHLNLNVDGWVNIVSPTSNVPFNPTATTKPPKPTDETEPPDERPTEPLATERP